MVLCRGVILLYSDIIIIRLNGGTYLVVIRSDYIMLYLYCAYSLSENEGLLIFAIFFYVVDYNGN